MKRYYINKEKARQEAIEWQTSFSEKDYSWHDLMIFSAHFEKLAKRYGLVKEFKENGVI